MESKVAKKRKLSCNLKFSNHKEHYSFSWSIENFSLYPRPTVQQPVEGKISRFSDALEYLESSPFSSGESVSQEATWKLILHPFKLVNAKEFVGIYLHKIDGKQNISNVQFKIGLVNQAGEMCHTQSGDYQFQNHGFFGWDNFISREVLAEDRLLFCDTLQLHCDMTINHHVEIQYADTTIPEVLCAEVEDQDVVHAQSTSQGSLFKDYQEKKTFCDVTLQVGNQEFYAHKVILAAHSPVFESMFQHDMEEKRSHVVKIVDIKAPVLQQMIHYIYSGNITEKSLESIIELYDCADKYNISSMMNMCSDSLSKRLSEGYVCEILIAAHLHNDNKLFSAAKNFILSQPFKVVTTNKWIKFVQEYPELAQQIMKFYETTVVIPKHESPSSPPLQDRVPDRPAQCRIPERRFERAPGRYAHSRYRETASINVPVPDRNTGRFVNNGVSILEHELERRANLIDSNDAILVAVDPRVNRASTSNASVVNP